MTRFNDLFSFVSTVALASLPLVALFGVAQLQAVLPATGI
jgi:hypothetical protein